MSNIIIKYMYPYVQEGLKDGKNDKKIKKIVETIIDKNSFSLFKKGPSNRIFIHEETREELFLLANVNRQEMKNNIKKITFINASWKALNNEFNFLMLCIIRFYYKEKKYDLMNISLLFLAIQVYAMYQTRRFKYVQEEVMNYTINNLNNKHDLKQYGTIYKALIKKIVSFHETYHTNLDSSDDKKLVDYIMNLNTRIDQWLKGILTEYIKNQKSGKYMNTESESYDEDNYRETSNVSLEIISITNKLIIKFISNPVNKKINDMCANICKISKSSLYNDMSDILKNERKLLKEVIQLTFMIFMVDSGKSKDKVASREFVNSCLLLYSKSNTINPSVLRIKEILDKWLSKYDAKYLKTERVATKIAYRKSIFLYIVFAIQYYMN